jgi:rod shape-determining protein MreC
MAVLSITRRNGAILVSLLVGQMLLMSGSARRADGSSRLESWVMRVSGRLFGAGQLLGGGVGGMSSGIRDLFGARARNAVLEKEVQTLRADVARLREAEMENLRLRRVLGMKEDLLPRSIAATVVTASLDGPARTIVLDRGSLAGIAPDQPVIAYGGAVGRVVAVEPEHAKVWLITDPNSGVAGLVQRSRAQGMVFGTGSGALEVRYMPGYADVMPGDRVVTSGIDGIFPRGYGLGSVISIGTTADGIQIVYLAPEVDLAALEEVLVVLEPPPAVEEPPGLEEAP